VSGSNEINGLHWRTIPTAHIEAQSELGQLANSRLPRAKRSRKVPDGPPDKKQSPASAGTERGAKRNLQAVTSRKISNKSPRPTQEPDRSLFMTEEPGWRA
jgi:hypothetical protein